MRALRVVLQPFVLGFSLAAMLYTGSAWWTAALVLIACLGIAFDWPRRGIR